MVSLDALSSAQGLIARTRMRSDARAFLLRADHLDARSSSDLILSLAAVIALMRTFAITTCSVRDLGLVELGKGWVRKYNAESCDWK